MKVTNYIAETMELLLPGVIYVGQGCFSLIPQFKGLREHPRQPAYSWGSHQSKALRSPSSAEHAEKTAIQWLRFDYVHILNSFLQCWIKIRRHIIVCYLGE